MSRRRELRARAPRRVLRLEEAVELVVGNRYLELAEELPHLRRVLDLFDDPRLEERRQVGRAEALGQRRHGLASERGEAGLVPRLEQVGLRRPLHERVSPVEQNSREHEPDTLPAL